MPSKDINDNSDNYGREIKLVKKFFENSRIKNDSNQNEEMNDGHTVRSKFCVIGVPEEEERTNHKNVKRHSGRELSKMAGVGGGAVR